MSFGSRYALVIAGLTISALCAADGGHGPQTTRQDLIGAWRLVDIEVRKPGGQAVDPFYGSGSRGLLIYEGSGWFSVQIEGAGRPAVSAPAVRPVPGESEAAVRLKAAVTDSYYAYFGTWSFDQATSTVTHHAMGALYPGEDRAIYPQHVDVVGHRMTFTREQGGAVQLKHWERVSGD